MLIDIHGHIGRVLPDRREFMDVANLIAKMDAWGIDKTCVLPLSEHPEGTYLECNTEDVITACSRFPDRLIAFCLIDPRYGNRPDGYGLRDKYGLPGIERALQECPETTFIGHGPTFWAEISADVPADNRSGYPSGRIEAGGAVPRLTRKYPNMWADISTGSSHNALTRDPSFAPEFLEEFQDKILFGTDSCMRSDTGKILPIVSLMRSLREEKKLPAAAIEKIEWNCSSLLNLNLKPAGNNR